MPQFDKFSFLSQLSWTLLFFFVFYFVILKHFLPLIGSVLKVRKKLLIVEKNSLTNLGQNQRVNSLVSNLLILNNLTKLRLELAKNYNLSCFWLGYQMDHKLDKWFSSLFSFLLNTQLNLEAQKSIFTILTKKRKVAKLITNFLGSDY